MTDEQWSKVMALSRCRMRVGGYEKRFVRDMAAHPETEYELTEKQVVYLDKLYFRYRKQIAALGIPRILSTDEILAELE